MKIEIDFKFKINLIITLYKERKPSRYRKTTRCLIKL